MPLGSARNYARLRPGEEFSYRAWIEALRAGRTYATEGPLLAFTVNGQEPGAVVAAAEGSIVRISATAYRLEPADRLELVVNGEVVASCEGSGSPCTAHLDEEIPVHQSGWVAARCWHNAPDPENEGATAHTSPVHVRVDGQSVLAPSEVVSRLTAQIDHTITWVEYEARCETDAQRQRLASVFQQARQVLTQLPTR
jgi:hypothetical protein